MPTRRFSASSAAQLMACPGSANLELSIPGWKEPERDDDAVNARTLGSKLHELFETAGNLPRPSMRKLIEALQYMYDLRMTRRFRMLTEHTINADWLQQRPLTTVDAVLFTQDELHIIDYKSGTIPVDPEYNEQLMFYAASVAHLVLKAKGATLHIIQPWSTEGSRSWWCSLEDLARFMNDAVLAEQQIMNKSTVLHPSDHCTFCPANPHSRADKGRPLCPAMMQLLYPTPPLDIDEILSA